MTLIFLSPVAARKIENSDFSSAAAAPAAAGAGTQAKLIAKHYNLLHLDTGRVYRYVANIKISESSKYNYKYIKKKNRQFKN